ncbi:hypothetical protein Tco_1446442 [Tanacetum coccineum]
MLMPRSLRAYYLPFMDSEMLRIDLIINLQETQQVIARDEKWVPSTERVKISPTNVRMETIHFWYTIKKVKDSESYEFILANKKCVVDAEVFRKILNICPRVEGEEFTEVQDDNDTLTFLIDLGYKGPLHKHTNMFVDHMHQPWRTLAAIINKCLSWKTASNDKLRKYKIDILIGEDYQEYELPIPETMLNDKIKQSESYKMFIKYSTSQIPPKKSRGKISQGKKTTDTTKESDAEPASQQTASRRMVKKKVTITAADNIIPDPDVALELGKSISLTKAEETEAARQVHATHARIVTEPIPESAKKKTSSRMVPDETTVVSTTSNEGTGTKPVVPDEKKVSSEANVILDDDEYVHGEEHVQDDDEETDDEFVHGDDQVNDDEDEEMTNVEIEESGFGDEEIADTAKADAEKTEVVKDDAKKPKLPPTSSSLSVSSDAEINSLLDVKIQSEVPHIQSSSVFTVHVSVISEPSVLTPIPETPLVALTTTLQPPLCVSTTIPTMQQATTPILTPPIITEAPSITTVVPESHALTVVQLRVAKLEQDVSGLKKIDHSVEVLATLKSQVPMVVGNYLRSKLGDDLQKVLQRHIADLIQKYSMKPAPESSKTWTPTVDLDQESEKSDTQEYDQKSALFQTINENKSFNRNPANHALYQALMEALIEVEKAMDKGVDDLVKNHKRQHDGDDDDDDEDPSAGPNQGKVLSKSSKTGKSTTTKEPVEEPIAEVIMDYTVNTAGEDVVHDDDQPQDTSKLKKDKTLTQDWFKQPPRPPTPDPE